MLNDDKCYGEKTKREREYQERLPAGIFVCFIRCSSPSAYSTGHQTFSAKGQIVNTVYCYCLLCFTGHMVSVTNTQLCCYNKTAAISSVQSVQPLSRVWFFATPWITTRQAPLSITNSRSSLRLTSIKSVMPSSHLILCRPLLLLPPIPPSIRVFSNESTLRMRWPKYWSFSFSIIPSKEIPGLISNVFKFCILWIKLHFIFLFFSWSVK